VVNFRKTVKGTSFNFLGFTFYRGKAKAGFSIVKVKSEGKRVRSKLKKTKQWIRQVKDRLPLKDIWDLLRMKLEGHIRYYGVSFNIPRVQKFIHGVVRIVFKWLNRRSQRKSFTWEKFMLFIKANPLPKARVCCKLY
jgi:hypothetical protein